MASNLEEAETSLHQTARMQPSPDSSLHRTFFHFGIEHAHTIFSEDSLIMTLNRSIHEMSCMYTPIQHSDDKKVRCKERTGNDR